MYYLDTSLLVSAFVREPESEDAVQWLAQVANDDLAVSEWVKTEFSAALAGKVRAKAMTIGEQAAAQAAFDGAASSAFLTLPFEMAFFGRAARLAGRADLSLRAGDALHFAIVEEARATLCTRDRSFARAAEALGLAVVLI